MVYIIGGSSHVGKTLVAQKLIEKFYCPCISLDKLKEEYEEKDDVKLRYVIWPDVAKTIKMAIDKGINLIVEGCYIPENWKEQFTEDELKQIHCKFIVMSEDYIRSHEEDIKKYANVIEKRLHDVVDLDRLVMCSKNFKKDCQSNGTPLIEISDTYNIDQLVESFISSSGE